MKTGEVAKRFGVSNKTIMNWTERFQEFMSDNAKPGVGLQREFNLSDLYVLNTIYMESNRGAGFDAIEESLSNGTRNENLPPETRVLPGESAIMVSQQITAITIERDQLAQQVERLRSEMKEQAELSERLRSEERERLQERIIRIEGEKRILEYRLEQFIKGQSE